MADSQRKSSVDTFTILILIFVSVCQDGTLHQVRSVHVAIYLVLFYNVDVQVLDHLTLGG